MEILTVFFWSLIGSIFSLAGGLVLVNNKKALKIATRYGLPFGAGALLAAAFLGVLPEALEALDGHEALIWTLGGFLSFFILERCLGWFHHHHEHHHHDKAHGRNDNSHQWLVIIGDTLHNAIDGVAIGAAFLVNPAAGIGTAIAVAAHEIPQEIGDFGILLGKGMRPKKVVLVNALSGVATVVAALLTFSIGDNINPAPLLAIAAGFFIYVAASDIIPDIHEMPRQQGNKQALTLLIGVGLVSAVILSAPHSHEAEPDTVEQDSHHEHDHTHDL